MSSLTDYETDTWPYIAAKYQQKGRKRPVRLIVLHSTESLEVEGGAKAVATYFKNPSRPGSSHIVVDDKEIYQCVHDGDTAAGAVGANQDGLHIEQVGKADQTPLQWDDPYSNDVIRKAASVAAQYCLKFLLPVNHLSNEQLKAGAKGIVGHYQVSTVYPGTGHYDPGKGYPWDEFMDEVVQELKKRATLALGSYWVICSKCFIAYEGKLGWSSCPYCSAENVISE